MSQFKLIRYIADYGDNNALLHYAAYVYCRQNHLESIAISGLNKQNYSPSHLISLNQCEQQINRRIINLNLIYNIFGAWHSIWIDKQIGTPFGKQKQNVFLYQMKYHAPCAQQETLYVLPESLMEILGVELFHQFNHSHSLPEQDYAFGNTRITVAAPVAPTTPQWAAAPKNATVSDDDMPF